MGVLLVAALTLLPWRDAGFRVTRPPVSVRVDTARTAVQPPAAAAGILAALLAAAAVAWVALSTLPRRPAVAAPTGRQQGALAAAVLALVLVKLVVDTTGLAVGAPLSVLLAAALVGVQVAAERGGLGARAG